MPTYTVETPTSIRLPLPTAVIALPTTDVIPSVSGCIRAVFPQLCGMPRVNMFHCEEHSNE